MTERRSLVEGMKKSSKLTQAEEDFIYGDKRSSVAHNSANAPAETTEASDQTVLVQQQLTERQVETVPATDRIPTHDSRVMPQYAGRVPITTRTRPEIASAVKRAALTRQLDGVVPFTVQDIVEEALELWLMTNGYLDNSRTTVKD